MSVAAVILLDDQWNLNYKETNLLNHTIERTRILTSNIYLAIDNPDELSGLTDMISDKAKKMIQYIYPDTSLVNFTGKLRLIISAIHQLDFENIVFQTTSYPYLSSLDIMRLYQGLQDQPIEILTYKLPNSNITPTLFCIDTTLTKRRIQEFEQLNDNRLFSFFRSSFNTAYLPILSQDHRFKTVSDKSDLQVNDIEEVDFGEINIIRPGNHYKAFRKYKLHGLNDDDEANKLLSSELDKWKTTSNISNAIKSDLSNL